MWVFQGRITVTGLLDREKGDMYTLTVVADNGGPKKDSTVVGFFIVNFVIETLPLMCSLNLLQYMFMYVFYYRKLNGIPLLFIASLTGTAESKSLWSFYRD